MELEQKKQREYISMYILPRPREEQRERHHKPIRD